MLQNLIKLLEANKAKNFCAAVNCSVHLVESCDVCPFNNKDTLAETIKELKQAQEKQDV